MALKKCKECGKEISSKADKCPNCGAPTKAKSGCGCLIAIIIMGLLIYGTKKQIDYVNSPEGQADAAKRSAQDAADEKTRQAEQAVQQQRDADAAKAQADAEAKIRQDAQTFSAEQIVAYYKNNEVAADAALKGKVFKVSGRIDRIGKDILNNSYVSISANRADSFRGVQCYFDDSHLSELATLSPGQEVVIFGKCDGLMMDVMMKECTLMQK